LSADRLIDFKKKNPLQTVIAFYGRFFIGVLVLFACGSKQDLGEQPVYTGPIMSLFDINTVLSDSALVLIKIQAPSEEVYESGDREWKKGLFLQYFDEFGEVSSTFKSDYATYNKKDHLYKGTGNVIVRNLTNGDELNTEELYWDPQKQEFYTDRFVTIRTEDEIHTGEGLTANEDFSTYKILKPAGTFTIEEGATKSHETN
jgi:LPS export ABC transporter protein LptC